MSQMVSGLPFGPSLYYLFLLVFFPVGLVMLFSATKRKYGLVLLTVGCLLVATEAFKPSVEYNPFVSKQNLVGTWRDGSDVLTLMNDGAYTLLRDGTEYRGTWKNDDWNLYLQPGLKQIDFHPRVVRAGSELRIPTNFRGIDLWNGDLGLRRSENPR